MGYFASFAVMVWAMAAFFIVFDSPPRQRAPDPCDLFPAQCEQVLICERPINPLECLGDPR